MKPSPSTAYAIKLASGDRTQQQHSPVRPIACRAPLSVSGGRWCLPGPDAGRPELALLCRGDRFGGAQVRAGRGSAAATGAGPPPPTVVDQMLSSTHRLVPLRQVRTA